MICKRIQPSPYLSDYLKEFLLLHVAFDEGAAAPVKPYPVNPEEGITFHVLGTLESDTPGTASRQKRATCVIFGQPALRQNLYLPYEFMMVHVRFQPGALYKLLKIPMVDLLHQNIDATAIWGTEILTVNDEIANATQYADIPGILERFFYKKIKAIKHGFEPVETIGRIILNAPESFQLKRMASQACLSIRQFEKRFERQIGVTPKYYARICRFYKAYEMKDWKPGLDWLSVAVHSGYTDYQHLVKDFKHFAGAAPASLLRDTAQSPERRLNLAVDFRGV